MTVTVGLPIDEDDLAALQDSISSALSDEAPSTDVHKYIDGELALDGKLWGLAGELGWTAIALPEAVGGFGLGAAGSALLNKELGRVCAPGPFMATVAGAQVIAEFADQSLAEERLPGIMTGETAMAIPAITHGSGYGAVSNGKLSASLNVLGGGDCKLALIPLEDGTCALVEVEASQLAKQDFWDRTRDVSLLTLDNAPVAGVLAAGSAAALTQAFSLAIAADSIGAARSIIDKTIAYMLERTQFDRPIASFQALKHRVVDLVVKTELAEHTLDQAVETALTCDPSAAMWAALAKVNASDTAAFVAGDCVQLHGGVGYTWEYDVHIHLKRAKLNQTLVASNRVLQDWAAQKLADATREGIPAMEIAD